MKENVMKNKKRAMIIDVVCGVVIAGSAALSFFNGDTWLGFVLAGLAALDFVTGMVAYARSKRFCM